MKLKTTTHSGCWTDFITFRQKEPSNEEHTEAFLKELYQIALQIMFSEREQFTDAAFDAFPEIEGGDYSLPHTSLWYTCFEGWIASLSPTEKAAFATVRFTWA